MKNNFFRKAKRFFAIAFFFVAANNFFCEDFFDFENDFFSEEVKSFDENLQHDFIFSTLYESYDLNPHTATYTADARILDALYEGLYNLHFATLEPENALAKDCKISSNKLRWTFYIRDDAFFSDGEKITSQTIRDSWLALFKTPGAPYASLLDCIKNAKKFLEGKCSAQEVGITCRNNTTLILDLEKPCSHLKSVLCHYAFSAISKNPNAYSGAFKIEQNENQDLKNPKKQSRLILTKNEKYWNSKNVALPRIIIEGNDDAEENTWKYNSGKSDWATNNFFSDKILAKNDIKLSAEFGTDFIFFTCKNEPLKSNLLLRTALLAAIPWKELQSDSIFDAKSLVPPFSGESAKIEFFDPNEAKDLMNEARKELKIANDKKIQIIFGIPESERLQKFAQILQKAWLDLGVELIVQKTPSERYYSSLRSWNADLFFFSWVGDFADPIAFLELFRAESSLNETKWSDEQSQKFSDLLSKASFTNDSREREKILLQAEQLLLDQALIIPISHQVCLHAIDLSTIGGWTTNSLNFHPFKDIYFKKKSTTTLDEMILIKF